jgi:hypothetical protein
MREVFKVLSVGYNGKLESLQVYGDCAMTYVPMKWTRKRKYGSFVFGSLEKAIEYRGREKFDEQVWKCEASDDLHPVATMVNYGVVNHISRRKLLRLMDAIEYGENWEDSDETPEGTMMASQIRLVERITA